MHTPVSPYIVLMANTQVEAIHPWNQMSFLTYHFAQILCTVYHLLRKNVRWKVEARYPKFRSWGTCGVRGSNNVAWVGVKLLRTKECRRLVRDMQLREAQAEASDIVEIKSRRMEAIQDRTTNRSTTCFGAVMSNALHNQVLSNPQHFFLIWLTHPILLTVPIDVSNSVVVYWMSLKYCALRKSNGLPWGNLRGRYTGIRSISITMDKLGDPRLCYWYDNVAGSTS